MKEYAFCIDLKNNKEFIKKYKDYHVNPWPEIVEALKKVGVKKINIYLFGRRLFMILEKIYQSTRKKSHLRFINLRKASANFT